MKIELVQDDSMGEEIIVTIKSSKNNDRVNRLNSVLEQLSTDDDFLEMIPIRTKDRVVILRSVEVICFEINNELLTFHTLKEDITINGHLNQYLRLFNPTKFVQISRSSVINLSFLESLEMGFAGSLIAKLSNEHKMIVSRRYVKKLYHRLGFQRG